MNPVKSVTWEDWEKIKDYIREQTDVAIASKPFTAKPIEEWTFIEVRDWLEHIGFEKYVRKFREEEIDGKMLLLITENDARDFGMKFNKRKIFMKHLYKTIGHHIARENIIEKLREVFEDHQDKEGLVSQRDFMNMWITLFDANFTDEEFQRAWMSKKRDPKGNADFDDFVSATLPKYNTALESMRQTSTPIPKPAVPESWNVSVFDGLDEAVHVRVGGSTS